MSQQWQRVNELFHLALERPPDERMSFVATQAGGDALLRQDVMSLLAAHDRAGQFLEHPPARAADLLEAAAKPPAGDESAGDFPVDGTEAPSVQPGDCIGAYCIERELGRGGMGVVYLAEDTRLGRKVALKALARAAAGDERRRERLRTEARAAARLSHPGIATVFALEEINGQLFIASEYVAGETLRAELDRAPMALERVLDAGAQLARALSAAHVQGIVHRDLKPENVVCGEQAAVKILDFGVARSRPEGRQAERRLTETGTIVGTPAYMSPEQLEGADVDFRSDQFSFGVLLYEMATGVHPFEASSHASTIARILTATPRSVTDLRRDLPVDFDHLVARCLEKRPGARYESTSDIAREIERLQGRAREQQVARPAAARKVAPEEEAVGSRWWRVHQLSVVAVYAVMVAVAWLATAQIAADWSRGMFFAGVAAAALNGTLRVHLLFTERHNRPAFREELRRAGPWMRGSDALVALVLLALGVAVVHRMSSVAVLLCAVGAGVIIVSVAIEPATTAAAFGRRRSSGVGKRPQRK